MTTEPGGDLAGLLDAAVRAATGYRSASRWSPIRRHGYHAHRNLFAQPARPAHIGDSRGYLLRDGELTQITKDDTFVQTLVDEGRITRSEAHSHPQRLRWRALTGHEVER